MNHYRGSRYYANMLCSLYLKQGIILAKYPSIGLHHYCEALLNIKGEYFTHNSDVILQKDIQP